MKITNKKLIDSFKKAVAVSDINPILASIYLEVTGDKQSLVCTDTHRLHTMGYRHNSKESTVINYKTLSVIQEKYPNYKQIVPAFMDSNYIDHIQTYTKVKEMSTDGDVYKINKCSYKCEYIDDAVAFLTNVNEYYGMGLSIKLYTDETATNKPIVLYLDKDNYALIMPLNI